MLALQVIGTLNSLILLHIESEFGKLQTSEVILTSERESHIIEHHPDDYGLFKDKVSEVISSPDLVLRDRKNESTVLLIKTLPNTNLNVVVRLALEADVSGLKNSVMTFFRVRESNVRKIVARNKILYK